MDGQPELMLEADDFVLLPTTPGFTMSGFERVTPKLFDPHVAALAKSGLPVFPNEAGVWAVCRKCSELVDSEKWPALANHALRQFLKRNSAPRHEVPRVMGTVHRSSAAVRRAHD